MAANDHAAGKVRDMIAAAAATAQVVKAMPEMPHLPWLMSWVRSVLIKPAMAAELRPPQRALFLDLLLASPASGGVPENAGYKADATWADARTAVARCIVALNTTNTLVGPMKNVGMAMALSTLFTNCGIWTPVATACWVAFARGEDASPKDIVDLSSFASSPTDVPSPLLRGHVWLAAKCVIAALLRSALLHPKAFEEAQRSTVLNNLLGMSFSVEDGAGASAGDDDATPSAPISTASQADEDVCNGMTVGNDDVFEDSGADKESAGDSAAQSAEPDTPAKPPQKKMRATPSPGPEDAAQKPPPQIAELTQDAEPAAAEPPQAPPTHTGPPPIPGSGQSRPLLPKPDAKQGLLARPPLADPPLETPWSAWCFDPMPPNLSKDEEFKVYPTLIRQAGSFTTIRSFWATVEKCYPPPPWQQQHHFAMMRNELKPSFEHPGMENAGRIKIKASKQESPYMWANLMCALIGEALPNACKFDTGDTIWGLEWKPSSAKDDLFTIWYDNKSPGKVLQQKMKDEFRKLMPMLHPDVY